MTASSANTAAKETLDDSLALFEDGVKVNISNQKPTSRLTVAGLVIAVAVACTGVFLIYDSVMQSYRNLPQVYFEVKAIDEAGHPVAGASVLMSGHEEGVTDSFGEWRKYVEARNGASVVLELAKQTTTHRLYAAQNIIVPSRPPMKGDTTVLKTIAMSKQPPP